MSLFKLRSPYKPTGDQPQAIKKLVGGIEKGYRDQTLLGITGSGKTFSMASVIAKVQKPTLVISHNKTLAAQLASEFRDFFPKNAVHYFVSYYDYYQPESYLPQSDTYIEKETQLNEEIDRLRHASTQALLSRNDVIIVASVSCIYGLGNPVEYKAMAKTVARGEHIKRSTLLHDLVKMQYARNAVDFRRGTFRVKGEVVEIYPTASDQRIMRLQFFGDELEKISEHDHLTGNRITDLERVDIYPAKHYVTESQRFKEIKTEILHDLEQQIANFQKAHLLVEAQRLEQRVRFDLEMLEQTGYVNGIENYSRYFDGRKPGTPPYTLIDFYPKDFLMFIDESHITIPQIGGMYEGDKSRKKNLVQYGFRLPAAYDNRPLNFTEFTSKVHQVIYVSATPKPYEISRSKVVAEQIIRPTGLLDPEIFIRPTRNQVDDLLAEVQQRTKKHQRVLVTTLTKRMAEELTEYLQSLNIKVQYLHSEVDTMERLEILRDLRLGVYDVVVGINLLREGLDLPEVSLVAILDADKEGFLRSETSLVQTIGRAARHVEGTVIMYADKITDSMQAAISETERRRKLQQAYNRTHGITPQTIVKTIREDRLSGKKEEDQKAEETNAAVKHVSDYSKEEFAAVLRELEEQMILHARNMEFEQAAELRDKMMAFKNARKKNV